MPETIAPLVWIDCEMTGLDSEKDEIIEIYCLVTDLDFEPLVPGDEGWGTVVHVSDESLAKMDEWCTSTHGASGLTEEVRASTVTPEEAAAGLLAYVQARVPTPKFGLLAGNSVHADKAFLRKAPYTAVIDHLHYRILDVSSLKEAVRRWAPKVQAGSDGAAPATARWPATKQSRHRARDDILDSIAEARSYREIFRAAR